MESITSWPAIVQNNFNQKAFQYDQFAEVQALTAQDIISDLLKVSCSYPSIYEIGAGTGILTALLLKKLTSKKLLANDLCSNMICCLKKRFAHLKEPAISYETADFNTTCYHNNYDLIISNAVFQWFPDLTKAFQKTYSALKNEGILALSFFIEPTFFELNHSFNEAYKSLNLKERAHTLSFYNQEEILLQLKAAGFSDIKYQVRSYKLFFPSVLTFLKSVREIGATGITKEPASVHLMRLMLKIYTNNFLADNQLIPASYIALSLIAKKSEKLIK